MTPATFELHHGDCVEVMRTMPAESVDAIVTSPPYAEQRKSTYGGIPEAEYPTWTVGWMAEAWRLLKPNGSVIININPHTRKGQVSDYTLRTRLALRGAGWNEAAEMVWYKPDAMPTGRPGRPRRSWEPLLWYSKHGRPWSDATANGSEIADGYKMGVGRGQASRRPRSEWGHFVNTSTSTPNRARQTDVAIIPVNKETTGHPATFPVSLAEWCGKLIVPPGGTILDPFSGSASTGVAAIRNGWRYIGIDAVEEYVEMSRKRLEQEIAA